MKKIFTEVAATSKNAVWGKLISRPQALYERPDEIRSPFSRDATRILHSNAYRRLKHKTQVFFNIANDHICTRMEHVAHVESVSSTIAASLGLNCELTRAIAMGHDLGHAPFGHEGEHILSELTQKYLGERFWHERNGLRFVDDIELLEDNYRVFRNLSLTYAVRDGIISHCGEVDENGIRPRSEAIDLTAEFKKSADFQPYTWEGCVVKISDKIAYVGRDIEDAQSLGILQPEEQKTLLHMAQINDEKVLNTTVIMHNLVQDICANSSIERGICLSERFNAQLKSIKEFNYAHIYTNERLEPFKKYCRLVIEELFNYFLDKFDGENTFVRLLRRGYGELNRPFAQYLARYCDKGVPEELLADFKGANKKIYADFSNRDVYARAVIDYLSGMTDAYAVKCFNVLLEV